MNYRNKLFAIIFFVTCNLLVSQTYKNADADIELRIADLLSKMTLDEKVGQMQQLNLWEMNDGVLANIEKGKVGSFLNSGKIKEKIKLQKAAVEKSRLGIPLIFGRDVIHGYKTVLPIPLGQAASWNPELVKKGAGIAAREAAEEGVHWTFAPMIDIARDPRWGRIAESCGEDPYLASVLGSAMVKGFQGDDLKNKNSIAACAKHYVGYGAAEGGKDYNTTLIPERELRDIYLKPFHSAVNSGIATLMSGFNDLNGVPTSANKFTLKTILRDEWNFDGFVVSDWNSVGELIKHGFAKDGSEASRKAVNSGVNMEMVSEHYTKNLKKNILNGDIDVKWIDELVEGVLRVKFRLGLFENPYPREFNKSAILSDEHKNIAKQIATESIVLLQNKNNFLPLDASNIKSLAIIGPLADAPKDQLGTWTLDGKPENTITPLSAIKNSYEKKINITYAKGLETARSTDKTYFQEAVEAVSKSDIAILFLGEDKDLSGETHSRAFIHLPGSQEELIAELSKTGKPLILVIMAGRPLTVGNIKEEVKSILYAWHPGTMGGSALDDIIFGKVSPSGKLPVTFPRTVGQVPIYYNHRNTGRPPSPNQLGRTIGTAENPEGFASYYLDVDFTPAYYFGYGMSYSKFNYTNLTIAKDTIDFSETLRISVNVTNSGKYKAKETIQLYIRDLFGSVTRPVKELKAFRKVEFNPGETKKINFSITVDDLKFHDINMEFNAEPGDFDLFVGSSSNDKDLLKTKFVLKR
ncbi:MAG: glycoside hydrolase family 3 N-terminal domain-containing protein [Melioribacteraceae bacterium]